MLKAIWHIFTSYYKFAEKLHTKSFTIRKILFLIKLKLKFKLKIKIKIKLKK